MRMKHAVPSGLFVCACFAAMGLVPVARSQQRPSGSDATAERAAVIRQLAVVQQDERTVVEIGANGPLRCTQMLLADPPRLALDFPATHLSAGTFRVPSTLQPVRMVRASQFSPTVARVVIDLDQPAAYRIRSQQSSLSIEFDPPNSEGIELRSEQTSSAGAALRSIRVRANVPSPATEIASGNAGNLQSAPMPAREAAPTSIDFRNGALNLEAHNQNLRSLLEQIGNRTGIAVHLADGVGREQISANFQHYPLPEALRQMLKEYSVFFFFAGEAPTDQDSGLQAIWVFPKGQGPGDAPLAAFDRSLDVNGNAPPAGRPDIAGVAQAPAPNRNQGRADNVMQALQDARPETRLSALKQAASSGTQIPQATLIDLALKDDAPAVRAAALRALPADPDLKWVAERAMEDSDQLVSSAAADILRRLDLAQRARYWTTQTPAPPGL